MTETEIYKKQGFGGRIALGRSPALLVVDLVNGFVDPAIFGGGNILEAAERTKPVIELFRRHGAPIVFTRIVYEEDGSNAGVWCEKVPGLRELTESAPASHVVDFLAPRRGDVIIRKTQPSAFFETGLASILRYRGVDTIVVTGATTSGCVRASIIDAISCNFRPVAVTDCLGDRAPEPHQANLFDIGQKYANLCDSAELARLFQPA